MKKLIAVLLFSLIASPSLAQNPVEADGSCLALTRILGANQNWTIGQAQRLDDSTCEFKNVSYHIDSRVDYEIERIVVSRIDLKSLADNSFPPSVRLEATGMRPVTRILPDRTKYLMSQMFRPWSVVIDYDHDRASNVLHIKEVSLKNPYDIRISAELANVGDLNDFRQKLSTNALAIGSIALKSLDVYFDDQGFFAGTILMPVGMALVDEDADPAAKIEELRRQAIALAEAMLVQTETTKDSIAAVKALIAALPRPEKVFELSLKPSRPISLMEVAGNYSQPDELKKLLKSVALTASYHDRTAKCAP